MSIATTQVNEIIGFLAAACTTLAFVPQLVRMRQRGGRDLSYGMLSTYLLGLALWLVYGLRLHAAAIIAANVVGIVLVTSVLLIKRSMERPMPLLEILRPEPYVYDNPLELTPAYPVDPEKVHARAYAARRP